MTPTLHHACQRLDLPVHELYRLIADNSVLHGQVLATSQQIAPQVDSLVKAMIVLGPNTLKNMALHHAG